MSSISSSLWTNLWFEINGEPITFNGQLDAKFNVKNKSTITLQNCRPTWHEPNFMWYVEDYSHLAIKQENINGKMLWEGIVKFTSFNEIANISATKGISIQAVDYKEWLSSHEPITTAVVNRPPSLVVEDVCGAIQKYKIYPGKLEFRTNQIIKNYSIVDQKAYDIFNWIANYTNSKWTLRFDIESKNYFVDFYTWDNLEEGVGLVLNEVREERTDSVVGYVPEKSNPNEDLSVIKSLKYKGSRVVDYVNQVIVRSDKMTLSENIVETFRGDNSVEEWKLKENISELVGIFMKKFDDEQWFLAPSCENKYKNVIIAKFYYSLGDKIIKSNTDDPITNDWMIRVVYRGEGKGFYVAQDQDEGKRIGQFQKSLLPYYRTKIIKRNDILNQEDLIEYANGELEKYVKPYRPINLITSTPFRDWDLNKKIVVTVPNIVDKDFPIAADYVIQSINISGTMSKSDQALNYEYELTPTRNDDQAINFYDNKNNESSGETNEETNVVVYKNIALTNQLDINQVLTISDKLIPGLPLDNELNYKFFEDFDQQRGKLGPMDFGVLDQLVHKIRVVNSSNKEMLNNTVDAYDKSKGYTYTFTITEENKTDAS